MSVADSRGPGLHPVQHLHRCRVRLDVTLANANGGAVKATGSGSNDTLNFPAPTSVGWTYVNQVAGSTLVVYRSNELISAPIGPGPATSGAGSVSLIDPANFAGGVRVTGTPAAGQTIVASSATAATWGAPPAGVLSGAGRNTRRGLSESDLGPDPQHHDDGVRYLHGSRRGDPITGDLRRGRRRRRRRGEAAASIAQAGGAGGASGTTSVQVVPVGGNQTSRSVWARPGTRAQEELPPGTTPGVAAVAEVTPPWSVRGFRCGAAALPVDAGRRVDPPPPATARPTEPRRRR